MRKRLVIGLAVLGLVLAVVLLLDRRRHPENVVYQGKTVRAWALQLNSADAAARENAGTALRQLGTNAVPGLVRLLNVRDSFLRKGAFNLAMKLPGALGKRLKVIPPRAADVRSAGARALGTLGPEAEGSVPALAQMFWTDEARLRLSAAAGLGQIGGAGMPVLTSALTNQDLNFRYAAVCGLSEARPDLKAAVTALLQAMGDPDQAVRVPAIGGFAKLGSNALPFLLEEAQSLDSATRRRTARALGSLRIAREQLLPPVFELMHDPDPGCRVQAIDTLVQLGVPNQVMVAAWSNALGDPAPEVRTAAERALAAIGPLGRARVERPSVER